MYLNIEIISQKKNVLNFMFSLFPSVKFLEKPKDAAIERIKESNSLSLTFPLMTVLLLFQHENSFFLQVENFSLAG